MKFIDGDMLEVKRGIICHHVNCVDGMNFGLSRRFREKYPKHYEDYKAAIKTSGNIVVTEIVRGELYVVGLLGSYNTYSYSYKERKIDMGGMLDAIYKAWFLSQDKELPIYFPCNMGCFAGGFSWYDIFFFLQFVIGGRDATLVRYQNEELLWSKEEKAAKRKENSLRGRLRRLVGK